jgi:DNA-binding IclR family transcriptional regulator
MGQNARVPTARDRPPEEASDDSSFARGLRLLLMVADRGEIRADELANLLGTPLSSVYRYLRTLAAFGFVDHRDGRYSLGPRLLIGSGSNVSTEQLVRLADPILHELVDATGETALVARRVGLTAVSLHQVESKRPIRVSMSPGVTAPLHAGAMSRVLLAYAPAEILDEVVSQGLEAVTPSTLSEDELRAGLEEILALGIATSKGELVESTVELAVPILRRDGIVGALSVTGPADRCGPVWRAAAERSLRSAAARLSRQLDEAT